MNAKRNELVINFQNSLSQLDVEYEESKKALQKLYNHRINRIAHIEDFLKTNTNGKSFQEFVVAMKAKKRIIIIAYSYFAPYDSLLFVLNDPSINIAWPAPKPFGVGLKGFYCSETDMRWYGLTPTGIEYYSIRFPNGEFSIDFRGHKMKASWYITNDTTLMFNLGYAHMMKLEYPNSYLPGRYNDYFQIGKDVYEVW